MKLFLNGSLEKHNAKIIADYELKKLEKLKDLQKTTKHAIKFAFNCGGKDYFELDDLNSMLNGRAFQAIDFFNELGMKVTPDYLKAHCASMREVINGDKFQFTDLLQLILQLEERLEMILSPDIMYKIASVVYFDETEKPYSYDDVYGRRKIQHWKENGMDDFFLLKPIKELIPSLELSKADLKAYIGTHQKIDEEHLKTISTILSKNHETSDWYQRLGLLNTPT